MKPTVLLFHVDKAKALKIQRALLPLKLRVASVSPERYHEPVGLLAGNKEIAEPDNTENTNEEFEEEMMVMGWLTNRQVDQVLMAFRKNKIPRINYKAVITQDNQYWDCRTLYEELKKEHAVMSQSSEN